MAVFVTRMVQPMSTGEKVVNVSFNVSSCVVYFYDGTSPLKENTVSSQVFQVQKNSIMVVYTPFKTTITASGSAEQMERYMDQNLQYIYIYFISGDCEIN